MQGTGLLAAQLLLATVFGAAGIGKLADLNGSRQAVREFGLPHRSANLIGTILPAVELAVAGAFLATPGRAVAAVAILLLVAFAAAMALNLLQGYTPDCHCFGQIHSRPVSWRAVLTNLALAGIAVVALLGGEGETMEPVAQFAVGGLILAGSILLAAVARRREATHGPPQGLSVGTPAPDFALPTLEGERVTLASLRDGGTPLLLLFTKVGCRPCEALAAQVAEWQRVNGARLTIALVESGDQNVGSPDPFGRRNVLSDRDRAVADLYRTRDTPAAIVIAPDGRIESRVAAGPDAIKALVAQHLKHRSADERPEPRQP